MEQGWSSDGAGMEQWCELISPTNVAQVMCGFSLLLVFVLAPRVLLISGS